MLLLLPQVFQPLFAPKAKPIFASLPKAATAAFFNEGVAATLTADAGAAPP
jgi:hypothetical protein